MKLLPDTEECRPCGQVTMDCQTKHKEQFFSSCDKSKPDILENGFSDVKKSERNGTPEELGKNGDVTAPSDVSFRDSPAPSSVSESESEIKLVYSSENEEDVKNSSLINGEATETNKSLPITDKEVIDNKEDTASKKTSKCGDKEKLPATEVTSDVDTSGEDLEPKILEAHTDVTVDFSKELHDVDNNTDMPTNDINNKAEGTKPTNDDDDSKVLLTTGDVDDKAEVKMSTNDDDNSEATMITGDDDEAEGAKPTSDGDNSKVAMPTGDDDGADVKMPPNDDDNFEVKMPIGDVDDEADVKMPSNDEEATMTTGDGDDKAEVKMPPSDDDNSEVKMSTGDEVKVPPNDEDVTMTTGDVQDKSKLPANEDAQPDVIMASDEEENSCEVSPEEKSREVDAESREPKCVTEEEEATPENTSSDDKIDVNPFSEESVDISDNSETENDDSVAKIIENLENDGDESDSSLEREIANEDISNIDKEDLIEEDEVTPEENSEEVEKPKSPEIVEDSDKKTDAQDKEDIESMEIEESTSKQACVETTKGDSHGSKRSMESDDTERSSKKLKIDKEAKEPDKSDAEVTEPEPRTSPRLKEKSCNKEPEVIEKTNSGKLMAKNFFNLALTEEELRAMGNITRLSKKDLEKLVMAKTLETVALRSKLASKYQEVLAMQEKVAEYKKKIQPLNKQVHDLSNVVLRLEQSLKKNPKPVRPLKVTRSVGLQVSFNGPMTPKLTASTPIIRQGVKTLRPVTKPGGSTPLQPARVGIPPAAPKQMRPPIAAPSTRVMSTGTSPTKSVPSPNTQRVQPSSAQTPVARVSGVPSISPVAMSSLQSSQQAPNTAVVLPRQSSRAVDEERPGQVRPGQILGGQQFVMQNGKRFILPPQVSEAMAKQGSNSPVAFIVQSPQSQPMLITPNGQPTGQSLGSLNLQWVKNMQTSGGVQQNGAQRSLNTTASIRPSQIAIHSSATGVPLQRGSLYTVGPTVTSIPRNQTFLPNRMQHPAPLPTVPQHPPARPGWKLIPPKPILKISKVQNGIVLSWNMTMTSEHEDMKSYQIYAYQETKDPPSSTLWKTVGDVKALALPMACTLTQFKEGHKYHFSVRAVDVHSRMGPHSDPTSIVLK